MLMIFVSLWHQNFINMKILFSALILLVSFFGIAQNTISGTVIDAKKKPIIGANVFIEGTYDGATTDKNGNFLFITTTVGMQKLQISCLFSETVMLVIDVAKCSGKIYILKESVNTLDAVVIAAGTMNTGEKSRISMLKSMDIVTTAGSNANIVAALQTLPGTNNVGEDGRLFVRGGEADETQTYVDGLRVAQAYGAQTANVPSRGRFSPFLFSGISFSTGGYSAEYGEALSSVLLLNSNDEETENKTEIQVMSVGFGFAKAFKRNKNSIRVNTSYINLMPYQKLVPQNINWNKPFQSAAGEAIYRRNFANGIFKFYVAFDRQEFDLNQESINSVTVNRINLGNSNLYLNSNYDAKLGNGWQLTAGSSYGISANKIGLNFDTVKNSEYATHLKFKMRKSFSDRIKLSFGSDYFSTKFDENFVSSSGFNFTSGYNSTIFATFAESDVFLSKKFATKIGLRYSYNAMLGKTAIAPRFSMGYKIAKNSTLSLAYGSFTQAPKQDYLKYADYLASEKASHYILNYNYSKERRTLRTEIYFKDYTNLVKFNTIAPQFNAVYSNQGSGYAKGLEVFWRDGKTFKNLEYWLSYSYIDTKRDYKNYQTKVTPNFVAAHTTSIVGKYWVNDWKSQISVTYNFATGRPYNNPNETTFMNGKTRDFSNLSLSWAYLISQQKILYFSVNNVLQTQNVFGYEYASTQNANGAYDRRAITPTADSFFFLGFFWTISTDKKDNQLRNL